MRFQRHRKFTGVVFICLCVGVMLAGCQPSMITPLPGVDPETQAAQTSPLTPTTPLPTLPSEHPEIPAETEVTTLPTLAAENSMAPSSGINPLTGLPPARDELLERRPLIVKIQNVPRESRPQWGVSLADIVYEYYIEYGDTRFAAVYYGQQPEKVGPIRSARHVDQHLIRMYEAIFIYGGAYDKLNNLLLESEFGDRLIREGPGTYPALFRYEPDGVNYLLADLIKIDDVIEQYKMDNARQELDDLVFDENIPPGGDPASRVFVRFSGGMYNRWDFNESAGEYLRYSDVKNDIDRIKEVYVQLTDRLTSEPIAAANVVILLAEYERIEEAAEVYDLDLLGSGKAYVVRDGRVYQVTWKRPEAMAMLTLVDENGDPFPLKPGQTWFALMGYNTRLEQDGSETWRFTFMMP